MLRAIPAQPIYFLRPGKFSEKMQQAFSSLNRDQWTPEWINYNELKDLVNQKTKTILIIDDIDRKVRRFRFEFKKRSKESSGGPYVGLRILTAFALLSINPKDIGELPFAKFPICSTCMKGLNITLTGITEKDRHKQLTRRLFSMGANVTLCLDKITTILISNSWTTEKVRYFRRCSNSDYYVIRPEWVDRCWELRENIKDARQLIDEFRLPIFTGMSFCVSGFDINIRMGIARDVKKNGGIFSQGLQLPFYKFDGEVTQTRSQLEPNFNPFTTHLIVKKKEGPKYEAAMKISSDDSTLHIVNFDWFRVSKHKKIPQNEDDPTYCARDAAAIEKIRKDEIEKKKRAVFNSSQNMDPTISNSQGSGVLTNSQDISKAIEDPAIEIQFLLNSSKLSDVFNELRFHLVGFSPQLQSNVKKLLNRFGGTIYSTLVSTVTHIILGPQITSKDVYHIKRHEEKVRPASKVDIGWVVKCIQDDCLVAESVGKSSSALLKRINCTQDLDPQDKVEIARVRSEPAANAMENKLKEIEENEATSGNRNNANKRGGLVLGGGNVHYSPMRITKPSTTKDTIEPSIPVDWKSRN